MLENNLTALSQQQPCLIMGPQYDKRALLTTDPLALVNSLINLSYMTSVSKISALMLKDGGLELLVKILKRQSQGSDQLSVLGYSAALASVSRLAIRGTQPVRSRLVQVGVIEAILPLLERDRTLHSISIHFPHSEERNLDIDDPKMEDLTMALKLIAYVSKYPDIRRSLHNSYRSNIYDLVERFTSSHLPQDLRKWAIICMRNAFKRDGLPLRMCASLVCKRTESHAHEFSKCSRCRRVTYCCKECQKQAWVLHRNWCLPTMDLE
ncbi:hypothetical protein EDD86DRAFT_213491, partial [Gorgonomyces haynaldii]